METALRSALTSESSGSARPSLVAAARFSSRPTSGVRRPVLIPMSLSRSTQRTRVFIVRRLSYPMIYQTWRVVCKRSGSEQPESFLDPSELDGRRPRAHDGTVRVRDHAGTDLRGAVVGGPDDDGYLQRGLQDFHLAGPRVRMAQDAFVRRDRDAADGLDPRDGPAHHAHPEDLSDERHRLVVVAGMDDRPVVVIEDVVADRAQSMRERMDGVAGRFDLVLLDERGREDAFRIQRQERAHDGRVPDARHDGRCLKRPADMADRGLRDVPGHDQQLVVRRAENADVRVPRDLEPPKQWGPSVLREGDDGGAGLELDRLDADPAGRMLAAALPQVLVQHVVDEDPIWFQVLLHVFPDRLDRPRRPIRARRRPGGPQRDHHDALLFLLSHGLTPSACSAARSVSSGGG